MNKAILMGRLGRDPEVRVTTEGMSIARFSLAVDRRKEGVDFFNITAFGKLAEFCEKCLRKGTKILLTGRLQNDEYTDRNGQKVTKVIVIADEIEFCESKKQDTQEKTEWASIDKMDQEELPFNF